MASIDPGQRRAHLPIVPHTDNDERGAPSPPRLNMRCALVARTRRPAYNSCAYCTLQLNHCLQFRGQISTAILVPVILAAVLLPVPLIVRTGLGMATVIGLFLYLRYVARESHKAILADHELRRQKEIVDEQVSTRTAELAKTNAELRRETAVREVAEVALRRAQRLQSLGRLVAAVGHEINNPLCFVSMNLQYVLDNLAELKGVVPEQSLAMLRESIDDASCGAQRVGAIVRDLQSFRVDGDESVGPVNIADVVSFSLKMLGNQMRARAQVRCSLEDMPPVLANRGRLEQVCLNLLTNATQAIPEGHAADNEISVTARVTGHSVVLQVQDTGSGISPEVLDHIFDPFFTTKKVGEGMGLGLSICHEIITSFGGTIDVRSAPGEGTLFRLSLLITTETASKALEDPLPAEDLDQNKHARILVVDDEPMMRRSLQRTLSGFDVALASSGREAIQLFGEPDRFDVVVCDVMMGDLTGLDVHDELQRRLPGMEDRIIFMTGGAFTPDARDKLATLPNPCIDKPIDSRELRRLIGERVRSA